MSKTGITCYRNGGCGPYEMRSCYECPASKSDYVQVKTAPKPQTNADRIRAMSDEELARYLDGVKQSTYNCTMPCNGETCVKCWLDWLKEEAKT